MATYSEQLHAESMRWAEHAESRQLRRSWLHSSVISQHVNRRISGDSSCDWFRWIRREFHANQVFHHALSLGCNDGEFERQLVAAGFCDKLEGVDISPRAVAIGNERASRDGIAASFSVADVNTMVIAPRKYDLIIGVMAFHHFQQLEHVFEQVNDALTDDGILILNEYVGASRFQWPVAQLRLATTVLKLLPASRRRLRDGTSRECIVAPDLDEIKRTDPFEAVRSSDIISCLRRQLNVVAEADYGGSILHMVLHDILHNFDDENNHDREVLSLLCNVEDMLLEIGHLVSDFSVLVARKHQLSSRDEYPVALRDRNSPRAAATEPPQGDNGPAKVLNRWARIRVAREASNQSINGILSTPALAVFDVAELYDLIRRRDIQFNEVQERLTAVERGRVLRSINFIRRMLGI